MDQDVIRAVENDQFARYVGVRLTNVKPGYAETVMEICGHHLNGVGIVQGGATYTLADYAFAAASNAKGQVTVGINSGIAYFRPPEGKILKAVAREVSASRKLCSYRIEVFDESGQLIAEMNASGYIKG